MFLWRTRENNPQISIKYSSLTPLCANVQADLGHHSAHTFSDIGAHEVHVIFSDNVYGLGSGESIPWSTLAGLETHVHSFEGSRYLLV